MIQTHILRFVIESNRIEGIIRRPSDLELSATRHFIELPALSVDDVRSLVLVYQPDAVIRDNTSLNVRVGTYIAPMGGPEIAARLADLLVQVSLLQMDVWEAHLLYEQLHPFTDGNGRSGRAIWLWQMERITDGAQIGFLQSWYYQTLERSQSLSSFTLV